MLQLFGLFSFAASLLLQFIVAHISGLKLPAATVLHTICESVQVLIVEFDLHVFQEF